MLRCLRLAAWPKVIVSLWVKQMAVKEMSRSSREEYIAEELGGRAEIFCQLAMDKVCSTLGLSIS